MGSGVGVSNRIHQSQLLQLIAKATNVFRVTGWTLNEVDPDGLRYVATVVVRVHWFFIAVLVIEVLYRPYYGVVTSIAYGLFLLLLAGLSGYTQYRLRSDRMITWRWMLTVWAIDVFIVSAAVSISNGFSHFFFHLFYYPVLAGFAVIFTSFRFNMALVTMVSVIYAAISLGVGDGLDIEARDEKALFARIAIMYGIVATVNMISRFERMRWGETVKHEQALLRERTESSQAIHDTTAQTAYMIGMGIHRARELADESNGELVAALDATAELSKSAIWELRRPIDAGRIFEGRELGPVLWSHCATFKKITAIPANMSQSGTEPPLSTDTRARLFSMAHNALTNAFLHARPGLVEVRLDFESDGIRLSVSDDGAGLPDDYAERGRGFKGMNDDAERMGGTLVVESGRDGVGTTIACVVPHTADRRGG